MENIFKIQSQNSSLFSSQNIFIELGPRIPRSEHGDTAEYDDTIADFKKVVAEFSPMEQQAMAAGNAKRFYGLKDL